MSSASKEEVQKALGAYFQIIGSIVLGAWSDWTSTEYRAFWRADRSRANFVWEQMMERAHSAFATDPRIHILRRHESYLFVLDGQLAFRFKKSDETGLTSNYPTMAALAFHDPEQDLPGIPEVTRIDIVYYLNKLETAIADVLVVARNGGDVAWTLSVLADTNVVALPSTASGAASPIPSLVRVKSELQETGEKSEGT